MRKKYSINLTERLLNALQFRAELTVDLIDSFIGSKSDSHRKMRRFIKYGPREFKTDWADAYRRRQQFYTTLHYLQREGLVAKKKQGKHSLVRLTREGILRLKNIRDKRKNLLLPSTAAYAKPTGKRVTVVTFDIPEREHPKRRWIRAALVSMDFRCLQKSVWVGTGALPEKFLRDARKRDILRYVHIFSTGSAGTIQKPNDA